MLSNNFGYGLRPFRSTFFFYIYFFSATRKFWSLPFCDAYSFFINIPRISAIILTLLISFNNMQKRKIGRKSLLEIPLAPNKQQLSGCFCGYLVPKSNTVLWKRRKTNNSNNNSNTSSNKGNSNANNSNNNNNNDNSAVWWIQHNMYSPPKAENFQVYIALHSHLSHIQNYACNFKLGMASAIRIFIAHIISKRGWLPPSEFLIHPPGFFFFRQVDEIREKKNVGRSRW